MKLCRYKYNKQKFWGVVENDSIFPLEKTDYYEDLPVQNNKINLSENIKINEIKILPPTLPSKIVCIGRNYAAHASELGNKVPEEPLLFLKASSSVITENEAIVIPEQSHQVEHEGELAIVIGRKCRRLKNNDNPFEYVFGYTCLNDVTARDLQQKDVQFTRAKSFDTFCPLGWIVETDLDVSDIRVVTKVNGAIKQDGRTSQMVFQVDYLLKYISNQMTLNVGDVIATGTPSGVSKLNSGDVCEVEIEGIGTLRNPVV